MNRFAGLAFAAALLAASPRAGAEGAPPAGGVAPAAPASAPPAAPASAPSAGATLADRLFAAGRWGEAAVAYHRVARGDTGDGAAVLRVASYRVAVSLHYLGLHQASLGLFAAIADDPTHPRFAETLVWLAGLSTVLPEPDEVVALLGRYGPGDAAAYDNPTQRPLHARLMALLGRYAYRGRRFDEAIRAFGKVGPESPCYVEAEFLTALAHVQLRKPAPAARALRRLGAVLERRPGGSERARLLDLVHLSEARVDYSRALVGMDGAGGEPTIDLSALRGAVEGYRLVDSAGPSWPTALFESSWVYFMVGDDARALGNLRTFESPGFHGIVNPEVAVLQGTIAFSLCQYDAAEGYAARMRLRYLPVRREIVALVARLDREGGAMRFAPFAVELLAGRAPDAGLGADARAIAEEALSDRQLHRRLAHAREAEAEIALLARMPAAFRASALGGDVTDALDLARDLAARNAGALVRARLLRAAVEIDQHLSQAGAIAVDVARARAEDRQRPRILPLPAYGPFVPDGEHVVWPFDGEHWADELGTYRVVARSRCSR